MTDQIDTLNNRYEKKRDKLKSDFGLLHGERRFIDWKEYPLTTDPENRGLILIFFSDRILNLMAEELEMPVLI